MIKKTSFLLSIIFCLLLVGCGWLKNSSANDPTDPPPISEESEDLSIFSEATQENSETKEEAQVPSRATKKMVPPKPTPKTRIAKVPTQRRSRRSSPVKLLPSPDFVLGPKDLIEITVWGNKELTTEMPVRPDGLISFPLIGDVKAAGLTPSELKDKIARDLKDYITDANVTVITKEINSNIINISVGGQVTEPGYYEVTNPATLLHAISMAKGITEAADLKNSYLLRRGEKVRADFYALIEENDVSQNIVLQNNDIIFFPDNFENRVNIMGEVIKPQVIRFQEGMTVLDAILIAEGLTETAKPTETKIYRLVTKGSGKRRVRKIKVQLDKLIFDGDLTKNILLKPGDIILIPRAFF